MHKPPCQADPSFALAASYGNRAFEVTKIAEERRLGKRLARGYPMLEAEVTSGATVDFCCHLGPVTVPRPSAAAVHLQFGCTRSAGVSCRVRAHSQCLLEAAITTCMCMVL